MLQSSSSHPRLYLHSNLAKAMMIPSLQSQNPHLSVSFSLSQLVDPFMLTISMLKQLSLCPPWITQFILNNLQNLKIPSILVLNSLANSTKVSNASHTADPDNRKSHSRYIY